MCVDIIEKKIKIKNKNQKQCLFPYKLIKLKKKGLNFDIIKLKKRAYTFTYTFIIQTDNFVPNNLYCHFDILYYHFK